MTAAAARTVLRVDFRSKHAQQPTVAATEFLRHIRLERPLVVKMSGHKGVGVILKPENGSAAS